MTNGIFQNFSDVLKDIDVCSLRITCIRLHRSATYLDVTCCYRVSSVVCMSTVVALQKRLNRSRYGLGSGLGWAQGIMY